MNGRLLLSHTHVQNGTLTQKPVSVHVCVFVCELWAVHPTVRGWDHQKHYVQLADPFYATGLAGSSHMYIHTFLFFFFFFFFIEPDSNSWCLRVCVWKRQGWHTYTERQKVTQKKKKRKKGLLTDERRKKREKNLHGGSLPQSSTTHLRSNSWMSCVRVGACVWACVCLFVQVCSARVQLARGPDLNCLHSTFLDFSKKSAKSDLY